MLDCISKFPYTQYMFTLTNASNETKAIIKWGVIILIVITLFFALFRIGLIIKEMFYPTPLPSPTVLFGKLPGPILPPNKVSDEFTYKIKTLTGSLPAIATQTNVYPIVSPTPDLLALDKAKEKVKGGRFDNGPFKVSDTIYDWNTGGEISKTIRLNIETFDFEVTSNFLQDQSALSGRNIADEKNAVKLATDYLSNLDAKSTDLDFETPLVNFFTIKNDGTFEQATSLSNTKIIEVNFFKKYINDLPVFNEIPTQANVNVLIAADGEVVGATYMNQEVSTISSTYPLKTVEQAFKELKDKKAYIASYFGANKEISITDAYLAYYISKEEKGFVYPIIIFTGDDGFYAYVSAITDELIGN